MKYLKLFPGTYPEIHESVETFNNWFGESKVVDNKGNPMVVYHSTKKNFTSFKKKGLSNAFFFSSSPMVDMTPRLWDEERPYQDGSTIMPVYLSIKNPKIIEGSSGDPMFENWEIKAAKNEGYDGLLLNETTWVVFEATQIKSATGNNGNFDSRNPNILENKETIMKREEVIKMIKEDLTDDGDVTWEHFVDNQELGECQSIVSSIKRLNVPGVENHFGEIEIVDSPTDEDYFGKIMTHHWVTFLGEVLEFSKGTLTDYINWNDMYDVEDYGEVDYSRQIMIKESLETPELASGKAAFKIFLKIINSNDNLFTTRNYLNKGKYLYFFSTDRIQSNEDIIDELEIRTSLETAYKTVFKLKDSRLSFFFAVDEFKLFYGFYNDTTHYVYKVGKYNIHDSDLRNLPELDCLKKVNDVLIPDVDIKKRRFLNEIKVDFNKLFPRTESTTEISSSTVVKKEVEMSNFNEADQDYERMALTLDKFAQDFDWYDKVHTYIEIDNDIVSFYIKVV